MMGVFAQRPKYAVHRIFGASCRVPDHAECLPPIPLFINQVNRVPFTLLGMIRTCHPSPFPDNP
jgi:hypothetical protein